MIGLRLPTSKSYWRLLRLRTSSILSTLAFFTRMVRWTNLVSYLGTSASQRSATSYYDADFVNTFVAQILRVILFGEKALDSSRGNVGGPPTYGEKWGVTKVTPGAIALACVMVCIWSQC